MMEVLERVKPTDATVTAKLLFVEQFSAKPALTIRPDAAPVEATAIYAQKPVTIRDMRKLTPSLDVEGFALLRRPTVVGDFADEALIESVGRAEAANLVREITGAEHVHVFDHTVRRRDPSSVRQPAVRVHNDYTEASARQRVHDLFGRDAAWKLHNRVAFINVWRPIRHAADDFPLAVCDARSVAPEDLVATDLVYPERRGENFGLTYSPHQRWYYAPSMRTDEVLLIKCYDSREGVASITPHAAFENPLTPAGAPPRESIEFRAIAFFAPEQRQPYRLGRLG